MWFVPAPEMADPAARLRGGGLQARGCQRPTASRGASRPPWIDRAARASLLAALGRRLPAPPIVRQQLHKLLLDALRTSRNHDFGHKGDVPDELRVLQEQEIGFEDLDPTDAL